MERVPCFLFNHRYMWRVILPGLQCKAFFLFALTDVLIIFSGEIMKGLRNCMSVNLPTFPVLGTNFDPGEERPYDLRYRCFS